MNHDLTTDRALTPQTLVTTAVEALGGIVEPRDDGAVEVLAPPELAEAFGEGELRGLAFDPLLLERSPQAELATVGSPLLDRLTNLLLTRGTASVAAIVVPRLRQGGVESRIGETVALSGCRITSGSLPQGGVLCAYAQFDFRVLFTSDDRREKLHTVLVDLRTNLPCPELIARLPTLETTDQPPALMRKGIAVTPADAYRTAQAELKSQVRPDVAAYQARIERRLEVEFARIADYYDESAQQLRRRQERAQARGEDASGFDDRLEATRLERERKLREIADHYRLRCDARLLSARLLYQPKISFSLSVERKRSQRDLELFYDPVLDRMEPVLCESCCSVAQVLTLTKNRQFVCEPCAAAKG